MESLIWLLIPIGLFFILRSRETEAERNAASTARLREIYRKERLDKLADAQSSVEKRLGIPDGIEGKQAFIYWNMMRGWFYELSASKGYNEKNSNNIISDWENYLEYLEDRELFAEELFDMENDFATAIGHHAVEQLVDVRRAKDDAFDRSGKKPLAPSGFHYGPSPDCSEDVLTPNSPGRRRRKSKQT